MRTTSTCVLSGVRVSSGEPKSRDCTPAMAAFSRRWAIRSSRPGGSVASRSRSGWRSCDAIDVVRVGELPFRPALLEAPRVVASGAQPAHGLVCVGAERAAAVGHDLAVGGELGQPVLELVDRDGARAVDVAGGVLLARADVDEHNIPAAQSLAQ